MASLHELVEEAVLKFPSHVAVQYDDGDVKCFTTYNELWERSNIIRDVLRSVSLDNSTIGLCVPPSADLPAVILGILRAHSAFYPFDGDGAMFTQKSLVRLGVKHILVHIDQLEKVDELTLALQGVVVPCMELLDFGLVLIQLEAVTPVTNQKSLAYCITTSGTTSTPKVVRVPHSCIIPNITHIRDIFKITENDLCFLASPLTFDPSIVELFTALSSGATLLITSNETKATPRRLINILCIRNRATVLQMTPALLMRFDPCDLRSRLLGSDSPLRVLALGGEQFPSLLRTLVAPDCSTMFYNLYGITEVSTWATCLTFDVDNLRSSLNDIPLGTTLEGTKIKVIDSKGQEVTKGQGELLIGSCERVCLLNDEAEEDVRDKMVWRHTGDIVNIAEDTTVMYIGRRDDQIKRHGKRLNLMAIEHAIQGLTSVSDSRAVSSEDRLLLFLVAKETINRTHYASFKMDVKSHLQKSLPSQYHPDEYILIDEIPLSKHGKTDRSSLVSRWQAERNRVHVPDTGDVTQWCQDIWRDILGIPSKPIEETSSFSELGGDSLKAVQVLTCVEDGVGTSSALLDTILSGTFRDFVQKVQHMLRTRELRRSRVEEPRDKLERQEEQEVNVENRKSPENVVSVEDVESMRNSSLMSVTEVAEPTSTDSNDEILITEQHGQREEMGNENTIDIINTNDREEIASRRFVGAVSRGNRYIGQDREKLLGRLDNPHKTITLEHRWMYNTGKCVDASPMVAIDRGGRHVVYIGSHSHAVSAVDLTTGSEVWRTLLTDRVESSACLSQCGKWVVVGCYDNCVYVMCATSGRVTWKYRTGGCVKSSPTLDRLTSHIIVGSHDECLYALDVERQSVVWKQCLGSGSVFSSPCVSRHCRHVYVGTLGSQLHAVNADKGSILWSSSAGKPIFSSPEENNGCVVIGCVDGSILAFSHHGEKLWTFTTKAPIFSSPTFANIHGCKGEGILVGSHDSCVYCISETGEEIWNWEGTSPIYTTPFVCGHVLFGCEPLSRRCVGNDRKAGSFDANGQKFFGQKECKKDSSFAFKTDKKMENHAVVELPSENNRLNDTDVYRTSLEKKLHLQTELSNGVSFSTASKDQWLGHVEDKNPQPVCFTCNLETSQESNHVGQSCSKKQKLDCLTNSSEDLSFQDSLCRGQCNVIHGPFELNRMTKHSYDSKVPPCLEQPFDGSLQSHHQCLRKNSTYTSESDSKRFLEASSCEKQNGRLEHSPLVCVASTDGKVTFLDGASGCSVASVELPGEVFSSPVVVDGHLIVGCRDNFVYCYKIA